MNESEEFADRAADRLRRLDVGACPDQVAGEPHCEEVLAEVWLLLDQECDGGRAEKLRQHLDDCYPCLAAYGIEEKLKRLIARTCGGEQAPEQFRSRLRDQIRLAVLEQAEVTVEHGPGGTTSVEVRSTRIEHRG